MPKQPESAPEQPDDIRGFPGGLRRRWTLLACALLVVGLATSVGVGLRWRASVHSQIRQGFQTNATDVGETVETLLGRDVDLVTTLRGVLTMQPHMSADTFDEWFAQLRGRQRQVGGLGTTVVEVVPARRLAAFQARRDADPAFRALVGGAIQPVSHSGRAFYCLLSAGGTVTPYGPAVGMLLQGDWCDASSPIGGYQVGQTSQAQLTRSITDSGQFVVYPVTEQGVSTLFIEAAFYRRGTPLVTVAQRRAAVLGWVGSSFQVTDLIRQAIGDHRGLGLTLYHANPGRPYELAGRVGPSTATGAFTHVVTMSIDGRWRALVRGSAAVGLSAETQGLLVFLSGTLVSILLFLLVLVLTRSRERALGMVKEKTGELRHQSLHDALTGLPNRVLALDRAEQMLARARRLQIPVAALYVDIDGFKHVNDTFGHAAGDELLRTVAARLADVVREGDTAARLSGDEFVVLVEGSTLDAGPELVAERLLEVLRRPYDMDDMNGQTRRQLSLTASIGIALGERASAAELLRDADVALYEAKAAGKDYYMLFQSSMQTAARDRLTLEMDLAEALEQRQLFLQYQPTFDLQSESVIGVEALIRWRHPTRGVIEPIEFIPVAEESGLIVPIGRWVLEDACRQAAIWRRHGHEIDMSVNVSGRQLDDDELIEDVRHALAESGLDPETLTLEITETTLMRDAEATAKRLRSLKELGVRIAIDDFGTGYSSLAYLRQFPVDALKIDRSFISGIAGSKGSAALIHTLVQLGKTLDIETLAEGIEERSQLETLQREHCDHGQGFLFSRPLDVDAVEKFLAVTQSKTPVHTPA
ncbi:MAG: EAL domain-containing protein [Solirubrobacteraceae bacterium]